MRILQSKFTKTNPKDFQNRGAHARRAGPGSAFEWALRKGGYEEITNLLNTVKY